MRTVPSLSRPLRQALVAWALASAGIAAGAAPVSAQTTALFIDNHAGGLFQVPLQELVTAGDGTFTLPWNGTDTNTLWVRVSTNSWDLQFAAEDDARMEPGLYLGATSEPSTFNTMRVSGHGLACNQLSGRFLVREIKYSGNTVDRLAIDFEQHCGVGGPGLFGALRYNSTVASLT